jgi:SulP family sulfate permease
LKNAVINGLHFNNLRGDFYGGLTAAVVALPLALAMGVASGAGPIAGLYGAIFVGLFAALFGGTPAQVSGPTGPMTVVMAAVFTHYTSLFPGDPAHGAALAFTVVMLGGLFQILFGVLKLGRFIELVPHPVISGFMSGIGVIIILLQIGPLLGYPGVSKPLAAALAVPGFLSHPQDNAIVLGLVTLLIVYLVPRFTPALNRMLPAPLLALVVGTLVFLVLMPEGATPVLGEIPKGLPSPHAPVFVLSLLPDMMKSALMLAVLGTIDSLLTSLVADNITRTYHNPDRELIGQGIGNTVSGIFGGLAGAGATMRTVVNVKAGGRTPISGVLHAVVLLAVVLGAGGLAENIPNAVLAGILVKVGTDIIDWDFLRRLRTAPKAGVIIMFSVFLLTVLVDLITAVALGMVMASLLFMKRMTDLQLASITAITEPAEESPLSEEESALLRSTGGRVLLFHLAGPMSFGAAKGVARRLANFDQYDVLILDLSDVPQIDFTSSRALEDMIVGAKSHNRQVCVVGLRANVRYFLTAQGVLKHIAEDRLFPRRLAALQTAVEWINNLQTTQTT